MSATRSSSTRGGHEEAEWARSLATECPRTDKARKKNASSIESSRDPINRLSGISRRAPPRGRRGLQRLQMRAMVLAACRTLGPIVPMAAGRAGTRGAGRTQRGRGGGGGSSRGGAGGGRGGRGRAPPSRGEAAGQTGGVGAPSPRWGWDQRADAASEARRGVSTSRGPSRDALSPGNGDVASSSVSSGDAPQRVSKLMAWRGLCSRREAEELISRGVITVEGAVAKQGDKALSDARMPAQ